MASQYAIHEMCSLSPFQSLSSTTDWSQHHSERDLVKYETGVVMKEKRSPLISHRWRGKIQKLVQIVRVFLLRGNHCENPGFNQNKL